MIVSGSGQDPTYLQDEPRSPWGAGAQPPSGDSGFTNLHHKPRITIAPNNSFPNAVSTQSRVPAFIIQLSDVAVSIDFRVFKMCMGILVFRHRP